MQAESEEPSPSVVDALIPDSPAPTQAKVPSLPVVDTGLKWIPTKEDVEWPPQFTELDAQHLDQMLPSHGRKRSLLEQVDLSRYLSRNYYLDP